MASRSVLSFLHSSFVWPAYTQTDIHTDHDTCDNCGNIYATSVRSTKTLIGTALVILWALRPSYVMDYFVVLHTYKTCCSFVVCTQVRVCSWRVQWTRLVVRLLFVRRSASVHDVSNERGHGKAVVRRPVELLNHTLPVRGAAWRQTGERNVVSKLLLLFFHG